MIRSKKLINHKNIFHGFFNKNGGVSKGIYKSLNCGFGSKDNKKNIKKNLEIVSKKIGCKKKNMIFMNQIHSNKSFVLRNLRFNRIKGDGLITKMKKVAICVLTADCAPILIYDPVRKIIAIVHAGWRGAFKKILLKMLKKIIRMGSKKENIIVAIGPCIAQRSYEVKNDFKRIFVNQSSKNFRYFRSIKRRIYFSLGDYIKAQLIDFGIKNIDLIKKDTYIKKNNFFSSRYSFKINQNDYGRNISVIMIK